MPPHPLYNIPNAISMSRVLFAFLFVFASWEQRFALVVLAGVTDFLDGWIARRQKLVSRWGALIDPLSDRFFVFTAICVYLFLGVIETWHYFAFLLRDIMTAVGFLVAKAMPSLRVVDFRARWSGKVVTVLQIIVLLAIPAVYFPWLTRESVDAAVGSWVGGVRTLWMEAPTFVNALFIAVGLASLWSVIDYTVALHHARKRARVAALLAMFALWTTPARAQSLQPELRADAILATANTYHLAAGVNTPLGNYIRVGFVAGGGITTFKGESVASGRADVVGRFLIDPFHQQKWGPYAGAGISVRGERGSDPRGYVVAVIGLEGPPGRLLVPAAELGLGGGTRIGVILRRTVANRR